MSLHPYPKGGLTGCQISILRLQPPFPVPLPSPLSAIPGPGQPWLTLPGSIPTYAQQSRQLRYHAEGAQPSKPTWVSVQDVVLNSLDRPRNLEKKQQSSTHRLTEHDRRLSKEFGPTALNVVKKLHRQLGHPGNDRLVRALRDAKFDDSVVQCGRQVRCDVCESFAPRKLDRQLLCHKQPISMTFWRWTLFAWSGVVRRWRS